MNQYSKYGPDTWTKDTPCCQVSYCRPPRPVPCSPPPYSSPHPRPEPEESHGCPGPMGPQGYPGPMGPEGPAGPEGPEGHRGEQGPMGPRGCPGPMGEQGPLGQQGPTGDIGETGPTGPAGPSGTKGAGTLIFLTAPTPKMLCTDSRGRAKSGIMIGPSYTQDGIDITRKSLDLSSGSGHVNCSMLPAHSGNITDLSLCFSPASDYQLGDISITLTAQLWQSVPNSNLFIPVPGTVIRTPSISGNIDVNTNVYLTEKLTASHFVGDGCRLLYIVSMTSSKSSELILRGIINGGLYFN